VVCNGSGNQDAWRTRTKGGEECCDVCGRLGISGADVPDVYFAGPYVDPNLAHPDRPWEANGVLVTSKRHKAQLMAEQGLREAGDRKGGARNYDAARAREMRERGFGPREK
jgi:hypothetical protein